MLDRPVQSLGLSLRILIAVDSFSRRFHAMLTMLVEEFALALVPPSGRQAVTNAIYERASIYVPGGGTFEQGLFEWEKAAVSHPPFPASGRILLGGAGGGREIAALASRGYLVTAFEPSPALAMSAARVAALSEGCRMIEASYADLVTAVAGKGGPLAELAAAPSFDAIILGWGSFSHVISRQERLELLRAIRSLAPGAPVLLSFLVGAGARLTSARAAVRGMLGRLGLPGKPDLNDRFLPWAGYHRTTDDEELQALVEQSGYRVVFKRRTPYGHALLVPEGGEFPTRTKPD